MPNSARLSRVLPAAVVFCALHGGCGESNSDDESGSNTPDAGTKDAGGGEAEVKPVSDACKDAEDDDCYAANGLLGTWKCITDDITVSANGKLLMVSSDGQRAAGCIACDGTFQAESTSDSGGTPSVFSVVDGSLQSSDESTSEVAWSFCNEVANVDACDRAPEKGMDSARCYLDLGADTDGGVVTPPAGGEQVELLIAEMWTPTTIMVNEGDTVTIVGEGEINWYTGTCDTCTSTPVGSGCPVDDMNFLVRGIRCWSLVARIGETAAPFYVGNSSTFVATESGLLYLGVNDDNFVDNTGAWTATVAVEPGS